MISAYSKHGKHKRIAKFKKWFEASKWLIKRFGKDPNNPELENYYFKKTKS